LKVGFFLTARSNPIIEHCCELTFGPYIAGEKAALTYDGWQADAEKAGLW